MNNNNTKPKKNTSLSKELIIVVFKIYFSITLLITFSHMYIEYLHTKNNIKRELEQISLSFIPSVSSALWNLDDVQKAAIMKGIMLLPSVSGVEFTDQDNKDVGHVYGEKFNRLSTHSFYYEAELKHKNPEDQLVHIGAMRLYSDHTIVLKRIELGFIMIFVSAMVKSALLILLIIWAFRLMLNRPLTEITTHVEKINLNNIIKEKVTFPFKSNNELKRLQDSFNQMLEKISADKEKILSVEHEIQRRLEHEVQLRTEELTAANIRLKELASTDELTKIYNRRMFFEVAIKYFKSAQRDLNVDTDSEDNSANHSKQADTPENSIEKAGNLCFLMLDIDHFKRINDNYGHHIGDEILKLYAKTINELLRQGDLFGRLGGEEFGVLLQDTDLEGSKAIAEKIRQAIEDCVYEDNECRVTMTTSIGISEIYAIDNSISEIQKRADEALYQAKNGGRNRWMLYSPEMKEAD